MVQPAPATAFDRYKTVGSTEIWRLSRAGSHDPFFYDCGYAVDFDGSPKAYAPHGTQGALDALGNAGHPGNWWGLVTNDGKKTGTPIVQSGIPPGQPHKGFYISKSSLEDRRYATNDVRRYVDATSVPFFILNRKDFHDTGLNLGDFGLGINMRSGKFVYGIFADSGPLHHVGECSSYFAGQLGLRNDRHGGAAHGVMFIVFPKSGSGNGSVPTNAAIQSTGRALLTKLSTMQDMDNALLDAYPKFPAVAHALMAAGYLRKVGGGRPVRFAT